MWGIQGGRSIELITFGIRRLEVNQSKSDHYTLIRPRSATLATPKPAEVQRKLRGSQNSEYSCSFWVLVVSSSSVNFSRRKQRKFVDLIFLTKMSAVNFEFHAVRIVRVGQNNCIRVVHFSRGAMLINQLFGQLNGATRENGPKKGKSRRCKYLVAPVCGASGEHNVECNSYLQ